MKRSLVLALGCMLVLLGPASVNAGKPDAVDPGIVTGIEPDV